MRLGMKNILSFLTGIAFLLFFRCSCLPAAPQEPESNVNSRYTVEGVQLRGASESKLSQSLREDMQKLVGEKFNQNATNAIASRLTDELHDLWVRTKVQRGDKPEHVKIVFEAERRWFQKFYVEQSRIVYQSKQGWSGRLSATMESHHNAVTVGFKNSADEFLERDAGLILGYEHRKLGTDRLRLRMSFESLHEKWNPATEKALMLAPGLPGIYRARQDFAPSLSVLPWRDLEISAGSSFQRFQIQYPAIHTRVANTAVLSAAYRHSFQTTHGFRHQLSAEYSLRSASQAMDSDFVYTRHFVNGRYSANWGKNQVSFDLLAGRIAGTAPLSERFSLGNSMLLRGWNKFDVAPAGGSRLAYGSAAYRYSVFQVFYDAGSVWDSGGATKFRHSIGFGLVSRERSHMFLLLGVPLRMHHVTPIVTLGIRL
jgi:hypothetical protein